VDSSFARTLESGGGSRTRLRGIEENPKRYFILKSAYNLDVIFRQLFGIGTERSLQGMEKAFENAFLAALSLPGRLLPSTKFTRKNLGRKSDFAKKLLPQIYDHHKIARSDIFNGLLDKASSSQSPDVKQRDKPKQPNQKTNVHAKNLST
jgi:hypothetical protein